MVEHLQIFLTVILVIWNFWLLFYIIQLNKHTQKPYIRGILTLVSIYLAFYILGFIRMYLIKNTEENLLPKIIELIELLWVFMRIWVIYLFIKIVLDFRNKGISSKLKKWIITIGILLLSVYIYKLYRPFDAFTVTIIDLVLSLLERFHNWIKIAILLTSIIFSKGIQRDIRILSKNFSIYFASAYTISIIVTYLFKDNSTQLSFVLLSTLRWALFLLAPLLWIRLIYKPYAHSLKKILAKEDSYEVIYRQFDISKREKDIIELILDGKGNDEIKDTLFISYHTVKNHLSNIYKKLQVKNRYELVHFFIKEINKIKSMKIHG